jgi:hypothetical protein
MKIIEVLEPERPQLSLKKKEGWLSILAKRWLLIVIG